MRKDEDGVPHVVKAKRVKRRRKPWFERNWKHILIAVSVLFLFQSMRGCLNSTEHRIEMKKIEAERDSVYQVKDQQIVELQNLLEDAQDIIQEQSYELKLAGVKAEEADKRAQAIQETAAKIKQNTTIEIKADTTRNKINQNGI
jgi:hypothetical protein